MSGFVGMCLVHGRGQAWAGNRQGRAGGAAARRGERRPGRLMSARGQARACGAAQLKAFAPAPHTRGVLHQVVIVHLALAVLHGLKMGSVSHTRQARFHLEVTRGRAPGRAACRGAQGCPAAPRRPQRGPPCPTLLPATRSPCTAPPGFRRRSAVGAMMRVGHDMSRP